jgi:hypothetical protein
MKSTTLTLAEIVGFVAVFSFVVEGAMAVRYFAIGDMFGLVVSVIAAVVVLMLASVLLRHRLHRSPKIR